MILLLIVLIGPLLILAWMARTVVTEPRMAALALGIGIFLYLIDHHG